MKFKEVYEIEIQWVYCPICKNKTRIKIRFDTEMKKFPLFCPKCKQETLINVENLHMDSRDRAVILLAGLPSLNNSLRLGIHEPLRQRIVMNYNLDGMTKEEGRAYIHAKLKGAGYTQTVFEDAAIEAVLNAADGTPRIINKLCNASLLIGNSSNLNIINTDAVMQAINDCELG